METFVINTTGKKYGISGKQMEMRIAVSEIKNTK